MSMVPIKLPKMLHCIILPMESRQQRGKHILAGCYVDVVVILGGEMKFQMCGPVWWEWRGCNWKCVKQVEPTRVPRSITGRWWEICLCGWSLLVWSELFVFTQVSPSPFFPRPCGCRRRGLDHQTNIRIINLQHQVAVSIQLLKQALLVRCHHKPLHVGLNFHRSQGQRLLPFGGLHYEMS